MRRSGEFLVAVAVCAIAAFLPRTGFEKPDQAELMEGSPAVVTPLPEPALPTLLQQVSLDGIKVGMSRKELLQRWRIADPGPPPSDPDTQQSFQDATGKTEAFLTSQGRVCSILGETLEYRGHKLPLGATKAELTKLLGIPENVEHEGPRLYGTWSYLDGCIQAHYNSLRIVSRYELRTPGI